MTLFMRVVPARFGAATAVLLASAAIAAIPAGSTGRPAMLMLFDQLLPSIGL